jgi:hypothetical protein
MIRSNRKLNMTKRKTPVRPKEHSTPKLPDAVLALLHEQHRRVRQATAIVSCAMYASESMVIRRESGGEPDLAKGLEVAFDLLCQVTEVLEQLIPQRYFGTRRVSDRDRNDESDTHRLRAFASSARPSCHAVLAVNGCARSALASLAGRLRPLTACASAWAASRAGNPPAQAEGCRHEEHGRSATAGDG